MELLRNHPKVALILVNGAWEADVKARRVAEHRHRQLLLQCAREQLRFDWMFCFDADERITGDLRGLASGPRAESCDGVSIRLFDAYLTPDDCMPYRPGQELFGLRQFYGPERRDILMLWRNRSDIFFAEGHERQRVGLAGRAPISTASTMANRYQSSIGRRRATTISNTFRSKRTDGNGSPVRGRQSIPDPISCVRSMNGAIRCLRTLLGFERVRSMHVGFGSITTDAFAASMPSDPKQSQNGRTGKTLTLSRASFHASIASQHRHEPRPATFYHMQPAYGYSSMPASAALRCQSNTADWSSWACDDGIAGRDS